MIRLESSPLSLLEVHTTAFRTATAGGGCSWHAGITPTPCWTQRHKLVTSRHIFLGSTEFSQCTTRGSRSSWAAGAATSGVKQPLAMNVETFDTGVTDAMVSRAVSAAVCRKLVTDCMRNAGAAGEHRPLRYQLQVRTANEQAP